MHILRPKLDNKPLGAKLNEYIKIEFCTDGNAYHLVDWPKDKKTTWKVLLNNNTCVLDCQVEYYSKNEISFMMEI